jgi:hypothetical protein
MRIKTTQNIAPPTNEDTNGFSTAQIKSGVGFFELQKNNAKNKEKVRQKIPMSILIPPLQVRLTDLHFLYPLIFSMRWQYTTP